MARIHHTTMTPGKLEIVAGWIARQPWYLGSGAPRLTKAGGFRLDDPDGEVGIEVLFVRDADDVTYVVPLAYRGVPLDGADHALLGTGEHGVLGARWFYDGAQDPVVVAQLLAFVRGEVEAQQQSVSDQIDASVTGEWSGNPGDVVEVVRVLAGTADAIEAVDGADVVGWIEADVGTPAGTARRRVVVVRKA